MNNSYRRIQPFVEIMDSTLRDGEQTSGVSFLPHEKLVIARKLLKDVNVDRIEVASARVSDGEKDAVSMICRYARQVGMLERVEVLGFVDGCLSVDWIDGCGGKVINLLAKGSLRHCTGQLHKTPQEHIDDILRTIEYAEKKGITVNLYLEDWSNGMKDSPEYVYAMVDALAHCGIRRFMLPDTLGIMNPLQVIEYFRKMQKRYPGTHFDFHAHNDYDLAVSNSLAAVLSGAKGIHVTVNGLGERCGNAPLSSVQVILKDQFHAKTNINESELNAISRLVEGYSGIAVAPNQPQAPGGVQTEVQIRKDQVRAAVIAKGEMGYLYHRHGVVPPLLFVSRSAQWAGRGAFWGNPTKKRAAGASSHSPKQRQRVSKGTRWKAPRSGTRPPKETGPDTQKAFPMRAPWARALES